MSWKCSCGVVNADFGVRCVACGTAKGMGGSAYASQIPKESSGTTHMYRRPKKKTTDWIWPTITDLESARAAARQGFWASIVVAVITAAVAVLAYAGFPILNVNLEALFDALLFAVVAWGIHAMSRTAAVGGLGLYLAERIHMWSNYGPKGLVLTIIFTLMFVNAIRGTFHYHKIMNSRLNVRNVVILNALGFLYSLAVFLICVAVLVMSAVMGVDIETIDQTVLGFVILAGMCIVYALTLMRWMPFTKERQMIA